ncbi:ABC transporter permease [Microbacterium sp.]|uniref:ABC transporter permease n=1 Tax=Microbacterium sp. TaxID=51671 RepID=UPI0028A1AC7D|nr:ABC transporter permease [Microbacterium sp.]
MSVTELALPPRLTEPSPTAPVGDPRPPRRRRSRGFPVGFWFALGFFAIVVVAALVPGALAPYDPLSTDTSNVLAAPSAAHLLGTDEAGRDVLSRIVYGAQPALFLGIGATVIALGVGSLIGLAAGLGNRFLDAILMRLTDVSLAFPELLLALLIISIFGGGLVNTLLAIGIAGIPSYARLVRGQTLAIRNAGYVEAARGIGLSRTRVALAHVLPNAIRPVLVLATIGVGTATLAGAALTFLGLGVAPPTPEWGSMLSVSRNFLERAWWYGIFPGLTITALVISTTTIGRTLQRRLEGKR